jgi:hypothetical protein
MTTITHERLRADALRQWQAHYDENIFRKIGMRAPEPRADDTILNYRRETDRLLKRTCLPQEHKLYRIQWRGLEADALDPLEPQLFAACEKEYTNPTNIPPGELRMVTKTYKDGQKYNDFYGQESFVKQMMRPGRRVVSWRTDQGYLHPNGHAMAVQQTRP